MSEAPTVGQSGRQALSVEDTTNTEADADRLEARASVGAEEEAPTRSSSPSGYTYGYQPLSVGSGAVSPSDLLIWLKAHSSSLSDQLHQRMLDADTRNKLVEDLTYLQAQIKKGADGAVLREEAQKLLDAYEGTPFAEDAAKALDELINNPDDLFGEDEANTMTSEMQSVIDKLGKDDQMDMIFIQELTSRISEVFGLGSNMMSSTHDTTTAIIGNLGR